MKILSVKLMREGVRIMRTGNRDMLGTVKGEINELHRRFCLHCRNDIVMQGHQVGKFIGIDSIPVICPSCGKETGCFRSQEAIDSRKASLLIMDSDVAKVKRFPNLYRAKKRYDWRQAYFGDEEDKTVERDRSLFDFAPRGLSAFKDGMTGGDEEDRLDQDNIDYDEEDEEEEPEVEEPTEPMTNGTERKVC